MTNHSPLVARLAKRDVAISTWRETQMPDQDLIRGLIDTYRTLNTTVRPVPEAQLRAQTAGGTTVYDVMSRFRDDELLFSQALKERVTGVPIPDIFGGDDL